MSDIASDRLGIDELSARIECDIAESRKLRYESDKLNEERNKLWHEARKFEAERDKLRRDRGLAPWIVAASFGGGIVAAIAGQIIQHFVKS
jgi:hypothetical protein